MTLIAVASVALTAGGCSLRSPGGGPGTYSSLHPDIAVASAVAPETASRPALPSRGDAVPTAALRPGFEEVPAAPLMPGDPTRPIPESGAGRVNPIASLSASARARDHWEALKPGEIKTTAPVIGHVSGGANGASTPAAASIAASAAAANGYDREAAMQNLINGGKSAGKRICNGC